MNSTTWLCKQQPDELLEWIHGRMVSARHVTAVTRPTPTTLDVTSAAISPWAKFVAVLLFPIGLLALLVGRTARVLHMRAEPGPDGGALLHISGGTTPGVQKMLLTTWNELSPKVSERPSSVPT